MKLTERIETKGVGQVKLTERQKAFCDYYIETLNATEAARRAGYSEKTAKEIGCENLTKPNIQAYIQERLKQMDKKRIASAEEVLEYLTKVMRGEEKEKLLEYNEEGEETIISVPPSIKERTKAAELLGKRYALFIDKGQVDVSVNKSLEDFFEDD